MRKLLLWFLLGYAAAAGAASLTIECFMTVDLKTKAGALIAHVTPAADGSIVVCVANGQVSVNC